jgi:hypothetical protein
MSLIEITEFVNNFGPRPARGLAPRQQSAIEPYRSRKKFRRHPDFGDKPTLKLAGTEARLSDQVFDPSSPPNGDHAARSEANGTVWIASIQHHGDPALDGADTQLKIRRGTDSVGEGYGGFPKDIRGSGVLMTREVMSIPTNRFNPLGWNRMLKT